MEPVALFVQKKMETSFSDLEQFVEQGMPLCQANVLGINEPNKKRHQYFAFCFLLIMSGLGEARQDFLCSFGMTQWE